MNLSKTRYESDNSESYSTTNEIALILIPNDGN